MPLHFDRDAEQQCLFESAIVEVARITVDAVKSDLLDRFYQNQMEPLSFAWRELEATGARTIIYDGLGNTASEIRSGGAQVSTGDTASSAVNRGYEIEIFGGILNSLSESAVQGVFRREDIDHSSGKRPGDGPYGSNPGGSYYYDKTHDMAAQNAARQ